MTPNDDDRSAKASPWHKGERAIHERMGNTAQMESFGRRVIRDFMPDQHREFYTQLPFIVLGAADADGNLWATLIEGSPGFLHSPDPRRLDVAALPGEGDPVRAAITTGVPVGMLGIELHTRRRNRLNGEVVASSANGFSVAVEHSFGNCPQYIQQRGYEFVAKPSRATTSPVESMDALDDAALSTIANADTFFVASQFPGDAEHPKASVDVSHRGGKAGFVLATDNVLRIPDFAGNMHFNTLGNLLLNPRAGLVFVDFTNGDLLQISGTTEIVFSGPEVDAFQGAERIWTLRVERVIRRRNALALRWILDEFSPNSLMTGSWSDAEARLRAAEVKDAWRPFRVSRIEDESSNVRSFYLEPMDGYASASYRAGQHLPIRISTAGESKPTIRTYTLSAAPSDGFYRISVKRQGRISAHMHEHIRHGDVIEARSPQGDFTIDALERRPAVMLAAGIGVTPMLSMLRHVIFEGLRKRRIRPSYFVYATRTIAERAFDAELKELQLRGGDKLRVVHVVSAPEDGATPGIEFDARGHIDMKLLKSLLAFDDYDFYLCGPPVFMQSIYDGLRDLRVADDRIHAEAFGPASLQRRLESSSLETDLPLAATNDVSVFFSESGKEARWKPDAGSLLDLAEQRGLEPEFSCRGGSCGTCRTKVMQGQVTYRNKPAFHTEPDEALLCCAVPAAATEKGLLVLKL